MPPLPSQSAMRDLERERAQLNEAQEQHKVREQALTMELEGARAQFMEHSSAVKVRLLSAAIGWWWSWVLIPGGTRVIVESYSGLVIPE